MAKIKWQEGLDARRNKPHKPVTASKVEVYGDRKLLVLNPDSYYPLKLSPTTAKLVLANLPDIRRFVEPEKTEEEEEK